MLAIQCNLKAKKSCIINYAIGESTQLRYVLFILSNCSLRLHVESKIENLKKKEKMLWHKDFNVVNIKMEFNAFAAYILTTCGMLVRLPISIFGD